MGGPSKPLTATALKGDDWILRRRAIIELSHAQDSELFGIFSQALNDTVSEVRHAAVIALTRLGDRRAVGILAKPKFLQSPDGNIRWATVKALGQLGGIRIIETLIPLVDDEEWLVRNEAISVLLTKVKEIVERRDPSLARILIRMLGIEDKRIVDIAIEGLIAMAPECRIILLDALKSIKEPVRSRAAFILGQAKDKEAVPLLIAGLKDDSPLVRAEAAKALGKIGDPRSIPQLVEALRDYNNQVKKAVVRALVMFGPLALLPLHSQLMYTSNKFDTAATLSAMGAIAHPSSIPLLIEHLSSTYYIVRDEAVNALSRYGREVIEPLLSVLSYNKSDISPLLKAARQNGLADRIRAIKALGDLEDHRAADLIKNLLLDEKAEISQVAQEALVRIGCAAWGRCRALTVIGNVADASIAPKLLPSLEDDSPHVRYEAIRALGKLKGKEACAKIESLIKTDPVHEVRTEAMKVLRELSPGSKQLFDIAQAALNDPAASVRLEATRALGDFADDQAFDMLIERLSDSHWSVRISAENAICNYGKRAVPKLIGLLHTQEDEGKCRIISALARIGDGESIKPLEALLVKLKGQDKLQALVKEALRLLKGETGRSAAQTATPLC